MPDMDSPALCLWRALIEVQPKLIEKIAFVTGDTLPASIAPFLKKPVSPKQVFELMA